MPQPDIDHQIQRLIRNLVEIRDSSGEFLLRLDDGRVIDTKGWNDWEWTHGIGLYGIWKYYEQTRDARCRQIMLDWFRDRFAAGPPTKNINTVAPFLTLAYLHEESPNPAWMPYIDEWSEWVMRGLPRTEENGFQHIVFNSVNYQQLWDDTLMMSVLPLAKIGRLLNRPHYVEEARRQFMLHIKYLVDRKTGLWFHGWTFAGRHHFANVLWARGNCWVTIAIPEFIELLDLQPGDGLREFLLETHLQQIRTLARFQDKAACGTRSSMIPVRTSKPRRPRASPTASSSPFASATSARNSSTWACARSRPCWPTSMRLASSRTCPSARRCSTTSTVTATSN